MLDTSVQDDFFGYSKSNETELNLTYKASPEELTNEAANKVAEYITRNIVSSMIGSHELQKQIKNILLQKSTHLDLSGMKLRKLPESIGLLTALTFLNLSYNELTILPESICNLTKLLYLNACHNNLKELPKDIGNLTSLQHLRLSFNSLEALPESILACENLESLILFSNPLTTKIPFSLTSKTMVEQELQRYFAKSKTLGILIGRPNSCCITM